jgi:hypothetical protein
MISHSKPLFGAALGAIAVVAAAASAFMPSTPAHANPAGSYQNSCNNIVDDGAGSPTIMASCRKTNGSYNNTSLAYKICQGDIWNDNGTLRCTPKGSFRNSCGSISWNSAYLMASCSKGGWPKKYTWNGGFSYNICLNNNQDIANCRGSLTCGGC